MDNPLAKFVSVDERPDGVYVKVDRDRRNGLTVKNLLQSLETACVINYNADEIERVFQRARNAFEKVGPPFEYYTPELDRYITVFVKPLQAILVCDPIIAVEHIRLTESILRHRLKRAGVIHGVLDQVIRELADAPRYEEEIVVAEGTEPQNGVDGRIEMVVDLKPSVHFTPDHSGKVNFRDIQTFVSVKEGQPIARRLPPTAGKPGMTVAGEALKSKPGKDALLPKGKNTAVSEDDELIACKTGVVYRDGQMIHVEELLSIPGDLDFSVGNIKYSGSVFIRGNVLPGFTVETEGNILIGGEVESARIISRQGTVTITGGVIGKGETRIFGYSGVEIDFAQDAEIRTDGALIINKYALHCDMLCTRLESPQGDIIGGRLRSYECVTVNNLGNDKHVQTVITIVNKIRAQGEEKIAELNSLKEKINKQLDPISRELRTKSAIVKKAGASITDRHRAEMKKVVDAYNTLTMKIKYVDKKINELREAIEAPGTYDGYVRVNGAAWPGVTVDLYGMGRKVVTAPMAGKRFKLQEGVIHEEG